MYASSDNSLRVGRPADGGFTLIEILVAIVLVGILSAVAVVGISNLVGTGSTAACTASADASRTASAVYFTSYLTYPADFAAMTTATGTGVSAIPAALSLPAGVTAVGLVASPAGGGWTLTMTPGTATAAPTFVCLVSTAAAAVGACPSPPAGGGWSGEYHATTDFSGPLLIPCTTEPTINQNWGSGGPTSAVIDNFSVRWRSTQTLAAGTYTFNMGSDDGSRLFIDGTLVLNSWSDRAYAITTGSVSLSAGSHSLVMEFYEKGGYAQASLTWSLGP